jgi:cytochrome c-type biogenesis protein CcmE
MTAGKRLAVGGVIVFAVTTYMAYVGASTSWKYYVTADECVDEAATLAHQRVRVSGRVEPGSLHITPDRSQDRFALAGTSHSLRAVCPCLIPDNLAEGMEVVVEGRLDASGRLHGEKVLTRCASKYESSETSTPKADATAAAPKEAP